MSGSGQKQPRRFVTGGDSYSPVTGRPIIGIAGCSPSAESGIAAAPSPAMNSRPITEAQARELASLEQCDCREGMFALAATRRQLFAGSGLVAAVGMTAMLPARAQAKAPPGARGAKNIESENRCDGSHGYRIRPLWGPIGPAGHRKGPEREHEGAKVYRLVSVEPIDHPGPSPSSSMRGDSSRHRVRHPARPR
jgi:hypothetical protein